MPISIHLPSIRMAILRPPKHLPANQAVFRLPRHLNKYDIRNYLGAVYNMKAVKIATVIENRRRVPHTRPDYFQRHPSQRPFLLTTMYKKAFVTFHESCQFRFPPVPQRQLEMEEQRESSRKKRQEETKREGQIVVNEWDRVVKERYGEDADMHAEMEMCEPLAEPLTNLKLDPAAVVKGQAKRRLQPKKRRQPAVEGEGKAEVNEDASSRDNAAEVANKQ